MTHALDISGLAAKDVARLALLNQSVAEIRSQRESIVAEKSREGQLPLFAQLPVIADHPEKVVSVIELTVVDSVARHGSSDGNQPGNIGKPEVAAAKQAQLVAAEIVLAKSVQLVLPAVLQTIEKA